MSILQEISLTHTDSLHVKIAYGGSRIRSFIPDAFFSSFTVHSENTFKMLLQYLNDQSLLTLPDILLIEADKAGEWISFLETIRKNPLFQGIIVVGLAEEFNSRLRLKALELKIHDLYTHPFPFEDLYERLSFLVKFKLIKPKLSQLSAQEDVQFKLPYYKRAFDIITSSAALLMLSPIFIITGVLIGVESKGPVIYKSKRVGAGYKIFDFYKFRSMRVGADKEISQLSSLNQYANSSDFEGGKTAFVKIKDDPRITKFGQFIRKTSLDELPQLINVLKGDMSLVGNRPLPLYEAEMLTSNEWSMRFLGPAGLTGLWQISKRGKGDMSERERKKLDNYYATNYSFWLDMKIILGTIPALMQKEKV